MNKHEFEKSLLEMMVTSMQLEKALEILNDGKKLSFEFDHDFNVSESLPYTLPIETLFENAVDTLKEIYIALDSAKEDMKGKVKSCTFCGRVSLADSYTVNGYTVLKDCETCEEEILES